MALKHIIPERKYSAEELYRVSESEPFNCGLRKWKRLVFSFPVSLNKGNVINSKYNIIGSDYIREAKKLAKVLTKYKL